MNRRIWFCLIVGIMTIVCALLFAACSNGSDKDNGEKTETIIGGNINPDDCQHSYGRYESDENATCMKDGTKTAYCIICKTPNTVPDVGSKLEHTFNGGYSYDNNASCTHGGTKTAYCSVCNTPETIADESHPKLDHVFTDYKSNDDATCEQNGTKTAVCDNCKIAENTVMDTATAGHKYVNGTCTECNVSQLLYQRSGDEYVVSGISGNCKATEIIIPAKEYGRSVTSIAHEAFQNKTNITKVTFPDSIILIGYNAFDGCTNLTSLVFGTGLTAVRYQAFANCTSLETATFPEGFKSLGGETFADCANLKTVNFGKNLQNLTRNDFVGCTKLESVNIAEDNVNFHNIGGIICNSDVTDIVLVPRAISGRLVVPATITTIKYIDFQSCKNITGVVIHQEVTKIEDYAFSGCTALTDLYYEGSEADWGKIKKSNGWNTGAPDFTIHYNYVETDESGNFE